MCTSADTYKADGFRRTFLGSFPAHRLSSVSRRGSCVIYESFGLTDYDDSGPDSYYVDVGSVVTAILPLRSVSIGTGRGSRYSVGKTSVFVLRPGPSLLSTPVVLGRDKILRRTISSRVSDVWDQ